MTVAVPLKHLAAINAKSLPETTDPGRELRYVDIGSVGRGKLVQPPSMMTFENAPSRARRLVEPGDTLVSTVRTYLRAVWPVSGETSDLVASTGFAVLSPHSIDPRFFAWWVQSDVFIEEVVARSVGVSYPAINALEIGELPVRVPEREEQRAIADYLDTETARIDALITKKQRQADVLGERSRSEVEHTMVELAEKEGVIPLKRLVRCLDGRRIPLSGEERSHRRGPYPYFGASGAIDSVDGYLFDEELVLLGEDGAQLADPDYEISFVVSGKIWVNNHAHVLRPLTADPYFLSMHLSTLDRASFISGATREKITQEDMNRIPVPHVPLERQREVARELRRKRVACDEATTALSAQADLLQERRRALVTAAVTGAFSVPGVA